MKILILIDNLGSGGAQNQMVTLVDGLCRKGHDVCLVTYYSEDFFEHRIAGLTNLKRVKLEKKSKYDFSLIMKIRKIINQGSYDYFLSFLDTPNFYNAALNLWRFKKGPKTVVSYRNTSNIGNNLNSYKKRFVHRFSDLVVCNSYHERDYWQRIAPSLKTKVHTIYNGIDTNRFQPNANRSYNKMKLLCVASVIPRKNAEFIVRAIADLKDRLGLIVDFYWIGSTIEVAGQTNPYFDFIESLIDELGIRQQWHWQSPVSNIEDKYHQFDALVLASKKEGVPNVICEAMSCGIPIFASNILDNPYLLDEGKRGYLFNLDDPKILADQIFNFYSEDQSEKEKKSKMCIEFIRDQMAIDIMVNKYEELLK